ncbi:MAG TPA: small ribosomal subunit Rsm22 family protein [Devosia sp.]|nr:small ribosomal subunit Rsm22 family protein [Devosia sp.]
MVDVRLPDALSLAIAAEIGAGSLTARAGALSDAYRARRPSSSAVTETGDVAAYLTTRLPATYAAVTRALDEAISRTEDFAPRSLLDAGAGPGTASWAAAQRLAELERITLLDHNRALLDMAGRLAAGSPFPALAGARRVSGSLSAPPADIRAELVICAYALTELADGAAIAAALALWEQCDGLFVIVEPGRPRDYERLMAVRAALFEAGARIVAPCPHEQPCPLPPGDWCHFAVRLPRSRAHRQAKAGTLGYEDEKLSYLAVARPGVSARPVAARVIRPPSVKKFEVALALCTEEGLEGRAVPRREPAAFKAAKKLEWGDPLG